MATATAANLRPCNRSSRNRIHARNVRAAASRYIFGRFKDSKAAIITALVNSAAERFVERSTEHNNFKDYKEYFPPYYM